MTREEAIKIIKEMEEKEEKRVSFLMRQVKKGCEDCSLWDDYWGCDKCERI